MWRLPGCSPEDFLVARRLAVRSHPVHHKLHAGAMIYNGMSINNLFFYLSTLHTEIYRHLDIVKKKEINKRKYSAKIDIFVIHVIKLLHL